MASRPRALTLSSMASMERFLYTSALNTPIGILRFFPEETCGARDGSADKWDAAPMNEDVAGRAAASTPLPLAARNSLRSRICSDFGGSSCSTDIGRPPEGHKRCIQEISPALYAGRIAEERQLCSQITSADGAFPAAARRRPP